MNGQRSEKNCSDPRSEIAYHDYPPRAASLSNGQHYVPQQPCVEDAISIAIEKMRVPPECVSELVAAIRNSGLRIDRQDSDIQ
jgi:hypothetical protein